MIIRTGDIVPNMSNILSVLDNFVKSHISKASKIKSKAQAAFNFITVIPCYIKKQSIFSRPLS